MKRVANIIECPRDAMQGIKEFIETDIKVSYIQQLLACGFDTLDFGSFVSPKAIPQLADTEAVLSKLDLSKTRSRLLAIVANERGIDQAARHREITYLGFPLSISETFQQRNTHASIADALKIVEHLANICIQSNQQPVVYLSMGFGNPYGDHWNIDLLLQYAKELEQRGIKIISLADTIGVAKPTDIQYIFEALVPAYPDVTFGAHFHTTPDTWREKVEAAWEGGCNRFDGAIKGYGGCPMAADELTGNMPTENLLRFFNEINVETGVDEKAFSIAMHYAARVFD